MTFHNYELIATPMFTSFTMFKELNEEDLYEHPVRVSVRLKTQSSITMSLYCNETGSLLTSRKIQNAKYLTRRVHNYMSGNSYDAHYLKITPKQSGQVLLDLIMAHIDNALRTVKPVNIGLDIHPNVISKGKLWNVSIKQKQELLWD